jgi:hypothetical protein
MRKLLELTPIVFMKELIIEGVEEVSSYYLEAKT